MFNMFVVMLLFFLYIYHVKN